MKDAEITSLLAFIWNEFKGIFEQRYILSIITTLVITLVMSSSMIGIVKSFKEGDLGTSLPLVTQLATIGVYNTSPHMSIELLEHGSSIHVVKIYDQITGHRMLATGQLHGLYLVNSTGSQLFLANSKMSTFVEQVMRSVLDKSYRKGDSDQFEFKDDMGLEDLMKGILAPILLFSPLFLFSVPAIQSIAYDRENKILEVLFSLNIRKDHIYLAKVLATMLFALLVGFIWLMFVYFYGFTFHDLFGVYIILGSVTLLVVAMNSMVSTISSNVQEASLSASILSTLLFVLLFGAMLFKLVKPLEIISRLTPTTYISGDISVQTQFFPIMPVVAVLASTVVFTLMGMAAFCTEKFAFGQRPGIYELFTGTVKMIRNKLLKRFTATFFSYLFTVPLQIMIFLSIFFVATQLRASSVDVLVIAVLIGFSAGEELLKGYSIRALTEENPRSGLVNGFWVGLIFGIMEFSTVMWFVSMGPNVDLMSIGSQRLVAVCLHVIASSVYGYMLSRSNSTNALLSSSVVHAIYNGLVYLNARGII